MADFGWKDHEMTTMDETVDRAVMTRHLMYAEMATVAAAVTRDGAALPAIASIDIGSGTRGTHPPRFRDTIGLQLHASGGVEEVAAWATVFGSPVRLLSRTDHVQVTAEMTLSGHTVVVWNHITLDAAEALASQVGASLVDVLDVDPARVGCA